MLSKQMQIVLHLHRYILWCKIFKCYGNQNWNCCFQREVNSIFFYCKRRLFLFARNNISIIRVSCAKSRRLSRILPFRLVRFLNVCVSHELNTWIIKNHRIRRISLCSTECLFKPFCVPFIHAGSIIMVLCTRLLFVSKAAALKNKQICKFNS